MEIKENFKFHAPIQRGKKGLWCQRLSYKDANGQWKQTSRSGFLKKRDITVDIKNEMLKEVFATMSINHETKDMTLTEFIDVYLSDKNHELAYNTKRIYKNTIYRLPELSKKPISKITFADCMKAISELDTYKNGTVKLTITVLKILFKQAISYKIISKNPLDGYNYKSKVDNEKRLRIFTEKEADDLMEFCRNTNPKVWILVALLRYCGLRMSEALGVCWTDISDNELIINKQFITADKKSLFSPLKTRNSYRTIPIPHKLKQIIREYRSMYPPFNENNRLTDINSSVYKYIEMGCPNHSPHDFRHTYATKLLSEGVDIRTVASLLGDTVATVEKVYIHYSDEMRKNAEKRLNEIFG